MPDVMKTVGRYEILREVGRGGMAMVYLARQSDLDRFVALKELGAFHASDPSFAQRFLRESRVAGSLSHPNIVTVHDRDSDPDAGRVDLDEGDDLGQAGHAGQPVGARDHRRRARAVPDADGRVSGSGPSDRDELGLARGEERGCPM
jgi:hypothetical protein